MGAPFEIFSPFTEAYLDEIKYTQSADVLYLVHPKMRPYKLIRGPDSYSWAFATIDFQDGPYYAINTAAVTFTPSATMGNITVTVGPSWGIAATSNVGGLVKCQVFSHGWLTGQPVYISGATGSLEINGSWTITVIDKDYFILNASTYINAYTGGGTVKPAGFSVSGVPVFFEGACQIVGLGERIQVSVRMEHASTWGWAYVNQNTAYTGTLKMDVQGTLGGVGATKSWAWGVISPRIVNGPTTGPSCVSFHEDRLALAGYEIVPQRVDLSNSSDYENFSPTKPDGTVVASNALSFNLNANDVNAIQWLNSDERGLLGGSVSAEWIIRPSTQSEAMSPTNISAKRSSKWGSSSTDAVKVGRGTIYVQRGSRKVRELTYSFDIDGYRATDVTELAEHITGSGVSEIQHCALPISIAWLIRNEGALIGMVYDRDFSQLRVGWHQHVLGGQSDAAGSPPIVESIAAVPSPDGTQDDLWMIVKRYINGSTVRTVEYLTRIFESIDTQNKAFFVDCGLTYDNPISISAITTGNPMSVTATAHGLTTGKQVRIDDALGLVKAGVSLVNGNTFTVTVIDVNTFTLNGSNGTGATSYVSGGYARKLITTLSGLTHLKNEIVSVLADGVPIGTKTVDNTGAITLATPAGTVSVGYSYNSDAKLLRLEAGSRNGTALGKTRRTHRVGIMVDRAMGLTIGPSFDLMDDVEVTNTTTLTSDIGSQTVDFNYDFNNNVCLRVTKPVPCMVLAVMPMQETQDRA
jgi:hypothetical protein